MAGKVKVAAAKDRGAKGSRTGAHSDSRTPKSEKSKAIGASPARRINVLEIRKAYGLSRSRFHRLSGFSERALANWESGVQIPDENTVRRLVELDRLRAALARILQPAAIGAWLDAPNDAFGSLKPLEVIERGETDRLWRMIVELESGMPV